MVTELPRNVLPVVTAWSLAPTSYHVKVQIVELGVTIALPMGMVLSRSALPVTVTKSHPGPTVLTPTATSLVNLDPASTTVVLLSAQPVMTISFPQETSVKLPLAG